ncbi:MAG: DUF2182 domain-containing protein [Bacteroidota bacterium]
MKNSKQVTYAINLVILGVSTVFWIVILFNPGSVLPAHHSPAGGNEHSMASHEMSLHITSFPGMMAYWILMLLAMMMPKLIAPVQYIYERTFKRKRFRAAVLFLTGYILVWGVAGVVITILIQTLKLRMPGSFAPAILGGLIAIVWQCSPAKQFFLNRGHYHRPIAAFGWAASRDVGLFGVMHGVWCVGSGWAIMLFPMLLPYGHHIAMMVVALIMVSEHMEQPQAPRWQFNMRLKLLRIVIRQTRIRTS